MEESPPVLRVASMLFRSMTRRWTSSPLAQNTEGMPPQPPSPESAHEGSTLDEKTGCSHPRASPYELFRDRLPMELWFLIVQHALEPRFAIMHEFLPQNIHYFYVSLIIHPFSCPDRTEMRRTKASLRLVCKTLNLIVGEFCSSLEQNPSWIWCYSPDNAERYGPCARLDTRFRGLVDIPAVKKQYGHEVGTVSIHVERGSGALSNPTLLPLVAEPWALKVLHITLPGSFEAMEQFPLSILSGLPSLRILSIATCCPFTFSGKLLLPQLTTLFLTCKPGQQSDVSLWYFPMLKNLAIDTRGWPYMHSGHKFEDLFEDLLQRHSDTIVSLRLVPMPQESLLPLTRRRPLPLLEAVATDFVRYRPQSMLTSRANYTSILHITHVSTYSYTWAQLSRALLETLKRVPSIQTLAITEDPFLESGLAQDEKEGDHSVVVDELEKLCLSRGIRIIGNIGSDVCCIRRAFRALKVPYT